MASTDRLELPDGQWAVLRTRPTNEQYVAIIEAAERAANGRGSWIAWAQATGRQLTVSWYVRGEDGKPLDLDEEGWDEADPEVIDAICTRAQELWRDWKATRRPLVPTATPSEPT